ncbi:MAG: short-chain dehydrogenase [Betaproteobacteria bacterium RIFCSPLOWO2_12_FULL_65_110]|nr:MAG: short-chain dehydrogenase [Betaproteobacteria bacterium RIFCSPLOWO2_12_FULL_65_110]
MTGASSGLGAALAAHYAARGAVLGLAARRADKLAEVAGGFAIPASVYAVDVADREALAAAASDFASRHGTPDIVIANAGVSAGTYCGSVADLDALERILRTNVTGLAATLAPFVESMRSRGSGTLVGIASVAGFRGLPGNGAYSASKAAAINWLEALRVELHGSGVRVVTVCPGYIDTPMTAVNRFPMPFLISAGDAARRIARAIDHGSTLVVLPWQMRLTFSFLRRAPNWLFDRLFARAPRKPRTR